MHSPPELFAEALAHWGTVSTRHAVEVLQEVLPFREETAPAWQALHHLARSCTLDWIQGGAKIAARPLIAYPIPRFGAPAFALTGAATRQQRRHWRTTARQHECHIAVHTPRSPTAPPTYTLIAPSRANSAAWAAEVDVPVADAPGPALALELAESIPDLQRQGSWVQHKSLGLKRRDFNETTLQFDREGHAQPRLVYYVDSTSKQPIYFLLKNGQRLQVSRRSGIYAALSEAKKRAATYDEENHTIVTPAKAPLPLPLERAAFLCSGATPRAVACPITRAPKGGEQFNGVAPRLAELLMEFLGQPHPSVKT